MSLFEAVRRAPSQVAAGRATPRTHSWTILFSRGKRNGGLSSLLAQTLNFKCSLAEQRSKTELIGNRRPKSYRTATRARPVTAKRGHRGSGGCTLRPAIHPPRDKFGRR